MQHASIAAAITLALVMLVATFGTVWQADAGVAAYATAPCPAQTQDRMALSQAPWEASLLQALRRDSELRLHLRTTCQGGQYGPLWFPSYDSPNGPLKLRKLHRYPPPEM